MALSPNDSLSPHFLAWELRADHPAIPETAIANLRRVAAWLESARSVLGVPLIVTSGYRTAAYNASLPGASQSSDHVTGLAADVVPRGLSAWQSYARLRDASGSLPAWDQMIFYTDGHVHVGLGPRMRREFRMALAGEYPLLSTENARQWLPVLIIGVLLLVVVRYA